MSIGTKLKGLKSAFSRAMRKVGAFLNLGDREAGNLRAAIEPTADQAAQRKKTDGDDGGGGSPCLPSWHREGEPSEEHDADPGGQEEVNYAVPLGMTQEAFYAMKRRKEAEERMRRAKAAQVRKRKPAAKRTARRTYQRMGMTQRDLLDEIDTDDVLKSIAEKSGTPDRGEREAGLSL